MRLAVSKQKLFLRYPASLDAFSHKHCGDGLVDDHTVIFEFLFFKKINKGKKEGEVIDTYITAFQQGSLLHFCQQFSLLSKADGSSKTASLKVSSFSVLFHGILDSTHLKFSK